MKKTLFLVVIAFVLFVSCSTMQKDSIYSTTSSRDNIRNIENIEVNIVKQYRESSQEKIDQIKKDLNNLLAVPSSDRSYLSLVYALYADYFLLGRDRTSAKRMLKTAESYNPHEEYVQLVKSRLIEKTEDRKDYLISMIKLNPTAYRLQSELGFVYYLLKDYTNALVAFDASLDFLNEEYSLLYGEKREYCRKFYKVDSDLKKTTAQILTQSKISLIDMATLTQDNTHALDSITGTAFWRPAMLADRLKAAGWYDDSVSLSNGKAKRRDAALFLWHLLIGNDNEALTQYSRQYVYSGKPSPIQDVAIDGVFFDAIIGTVEEDIIPLIDGRLFVPDGDVSGLDFYEWLKKADALR
ncbi:MULTISPECIES: hypothetical protein [unclassified Treponema]|uniref:hypothetical protein n=1 Tax=unclassified Treponema TaxID=2638727 RepID=UPI0020A56424|nr:MULTISPECIES: hypothetical protein [unclassified Treponema]UTC68294.1 hypothetical protein E4O06_06600 [Treponema sp. OMZ 789]UTC71015.1 hypothetical protein E4O01_06745 [Treponema sp. OMZ 790]UTC73756.1 hypothetical protein E4O02_06940 [Treponema sp. OMZ 791]